MRGRDGGGDRGKPGKPGGVWWAIWGGGYAAFAVVYLETSDGLLDAFGYVVGRDFVVLWSSGVLAALGHAPALPDPVVFRDLLAELFGRPLPPHNWPHGPHVLFITVALGLFPYPVALTLWSMATLGALLFVTRTPVVALTPAVFVNLVAGQTGCLVAALVLGGFRCYAKVPVAAGLLFALVAIKPHLGAMIPVALAATGAWRTAALAGVGVGLLVALSALAFGWEAWRAWLLHTVPYQTSMLEHGEGLFTWMMPSAFMGARLVGLPAAAAWVAQLPFTACAIAATWWAFRRLADRRIDRERAVAIACLAAVVATPYVFNYDLVLTAPAVWAALNRPPGALGCAFGKVAERLVWIAVLLLPLAVIPLNAIGAPIGSLILSAALCFAVMEAYRGGDLGRVRSTASH